MPKLESAERTNARTRAHADERARVASLNADGGPRWFIPPYVIPVFILILVVAQAVTRG